LGRRPPNGSSRRGRRTGGIIAPRPDVGGVISQAPVGQRQDYRSSAAGAKIDGDSLLLVHVIHGPVRGGTTLYDVGVPLLQEGKELIQRAPGLKPSHFGRPPANVVDPGPSVPALRRTVNKTRRRRVCGGAVAVGPSRRREEPIGVEEGVVGKT